MKYFTTIIQTARDGTTSQSISPYPSKDAAEAAFHKELAYSMDAKTLAADTVFVIDENGILYDVVAWKNAEIKGSAEESAE